MAYTYLRTKLNIPVVREGALTRDKIIERLENGKRGRLILVSAPAGYGKTTAISQWLHLQEGTVCWVSLDRGDNEPDLFFNLLMASIAASVQTFEPIPFPQRGDDRASIQAALRGLINDLAEMGEEMIITIDDYHLISNRMVHEAVEYLIEGVPPGIVLVLISRERPPLSLPRWRARGWLSELTEADLRFDHEQSGRFLRETMSLPVSDEVVSLVRTRVDGWVTGLQFTGLRLQQGGSSDRFLEAIASDKIDRYSADYLLSEVLEQERPEIQTFLIKTSILDRLSGPLCDVLLETERAQAVLEEIEARNLFTMPLDHFGEWFRYHPVMADLLQERLVKDFSAAEVTSLHRQAALWFDAHNLKADSIRHALLTEDYNLAAQFISGIQMSDLWRNEGLTTIANWINQLPDEYRLRYPHVGIAWIGTCLGKGDFSQARLVFESLEGKEEVIGEWHLIRGIFRRNNRQFENALADFQIAITDMPRDDPEMVMMAYFQKIICYRSLGRIEAAEQTLGEAFDVFERLEQRNSFVEMQLRWTEGILKQIEGDYRAALTLFQTGLSVTKASAEQYITWHGYLLRSISEIYHWWDELDLAEKYLREVLKIGERSGNGDMFINGEIGMHELAVARHAVDAATHHMKNIKGITQRMGIPGIDDLFQEYEVVSAAKLGDIRPAKAWLAQIEFDPTGDLAAKNRDLYSAWIVCQLAVIETLPGNLSQGEVDPLIGFCQRLISFFGSKRGEYHLALKARFVLAEAYGLSGQREEADELMRTVLEIAGRSRAVRLCREHWPLLESFFSRTGERLPEFLERGRPNESTERPAANRAVADEWGDTIELTSREQDILLALAEGLSNREIETKLFISKNTVRTHLRNLYSKLDVTSRTQAVLRGQELGLLE